MAVSTCANIHVWTRDDRQGPLGALADHVIICGSEDAFVNFADQARLVPHAPHASSTLAHAGPCCCLSAAPAWVPSPGPHCSPYLGRCSPAGEREQQTPRRTGVHKVRPAKCPFDPAGTQCRPCHAALAAARAMPAAAIRPVRLRRAAAGAQLRRCDADPHTPIVVLHERQPGEGVWAALQALGPTLFCRGEPSDGASLAAARAAQVEPSRVSSAHCWVQAPCAGCCPVEHADTHVVRSTADAQASVGADERMKWDRACVTA